MSPRPPGLTIWWHEQRRALIPLSGGGGWAGVGFPGPTHLTQNTKYSKIVKLFLDFEWQNNFCYRKSYCHDRMTRRVNRLRALFPKSRQPLGCFLTILGWLEDKYFLSFVDYVSNRRRLHKKLLVEHQKTKYRRLLEAKEKELKKARKLDAIRLASAAYYENQMALKSAGVRNGRSVATRPSSMKDKLRVGASNVAHCYATYELRFNEALKYAGDRHPSSQRTFFDGMKTYHYASNLRGNRSKLRKEPKPRLYPEDLRKDGSVDPSFYVINGIIVLQCNCGKRFISESEARAAGFDPALVSSAGLG